MNCLETQKRIRAFLDHTLTDGELKDFLEHVEHCSACREELDLYCGIEAALEDDDDHGSSALPEDSGFEELTDTLIQEGHRHLALKRSLKALRYVFAGILSAAILYVVLEIAGVVSLPWDTGDDEGLLPKVSRIMTLNRHGAAQTESETPEEEITETRKENRSHERKTAAD